MTGKWWQQCGVAAYHWRCPRLLAAVNVYDLVLVHELEYVGGVHQDADGPDGRHQEEDPQLRPVHHHGNELPVLSDLKCKSFKKYFMLKAGSHYLSEYL